MLRNLEERFIGELADHERAVYRHGACLFALVLASYYMLRPIREQISATYGVKNLSWLFAATFGVMLVAIPLYALLVGKYHRRKLVPSIYLFFISNLLIFWGVMKFGPEWAESYFGEGAAALVDLWSARCMYIWISVYGLFVVSFFWSIIGDMLSTSQGRKLFGVVAGGGTVGQLLGSQTAKLLAGRLGVENLLLVPAGLLLVGLFVYQVLERKHQKYVASAATAKSGKATGGNPFAGFTAIFKSRYLLAIAAFGMFLAICGSTIYFQQSEIVDAAYQSLSDAEAKTAKTEYFAEIDFYVGIVTLCFQWIIVGRLMRKCGLAFTLAILPIVYVVGIVSLSLSPTLAVLAVISVIGRAAEYGILNPSREVLFTSVNREDRYKAKSFIDTIVRRGGDAAVGNVYSGLREGAKLAMTTLSWMVVPLAVIWVGLAFFIGAENKRISAKTNDPEPTSDED